MKKQITLVVDEETTIPHLLNQVDYEVITTSREEVWTMIRKEKVDISSESK